MGYSRSFSVAAAAQFKDADGIKTSVATAATAQSYTGGALNGTLNLSGASDCASIPCFSSTSNAGSYVNGSAIVFVGTYGGQSVERTALITGTDGGQTEVVADGPLDVGSVTQIRVAAQVNTGGQFTFGFTGLLPKKTAQGHFREWRIVARAAGSAVVGYQNGGTDTLVMIASEVHPVPVARIYATTGIALTVLEAA